MLHLTLGVEFLNIPNGWTKRRSGKLHNETRIWYKTLWTTWKKTPWNYWISYISTTWPLVTWKDIYATSWHIWRKLTKWNQILARWWFQPIWKICSSNWIICFQGGVKIKNIWIRHLVRGVPYQTTIRPIEFCASTSLAHSRAVGKRCMVSMATKFIPGTEVAGSPYQNSLLWCDFWF